MLEQQFIAYLSGSSARFRISTQDVVDLVLLASYEVSSEIVGDESCEDFHDDIISSFNQGLGTD